MTLFTNDRHVHYNVKSITSKIGGGAAWGGGESEALILKIIEI